MIFSPAPLFVSQKALSKIIIFLVSGRNTSLCFYKGLQIGPTCVLGTPSSLIMDSLEPCHASWPATYGSTITLDGFSPLQKAMLVHDCKNCGPQRHQKKIHRAIIKVLVLGQSLHIEACTMYAPPSLSFSWGAPGDSVKKDITRFFVIQLSIANARYSEIKGPLYSRSSVQW